MVWFQVAAKSIGVSQTALLAVQALGGTAGNMICINNIISARTVVGGRALNVSEGAFIMRVAPSLGLMLLIGTLVSLPFLLA
jgi:L-lactate permease